MFLRFMNDLAAKSIMTAQELSGVFQNMIEKMIDNGKLSQTQVERASTIKEIFQFFWNTSVQLQ